MRMVSFQGTQLSASERRSLEFRQQVRSSFINPVLQAQVDLTLANLDQRKEEGAKPVRVWFPDRTEKGTPFVGDVFGFTQN